MNNPYSLHSFINQVSKNLQQQGFGNAKNEIIWYLESLKVCNREQIYINSIDFNKSIQNTIQIFYNKRIKGIPFQHILKKSTFYGRDFHINEHTLIPRPETELIISILRNNFFNNALEIGTGSGILSITLSLENIIGEIIATDISSQALEVAKQNIETFKIENILLYKHNFLTQNLQGKFDLIVSNPPYISHEEYNSLPNSIKNYEPKIALTDKTDGLSFYLRFADILNHIINPGGLFICELGTSQSIINIKKIFTDKGYEYQILKDLNGDDRILKIIF